MADLWHQAEVAKDAWQEGHDVKPANPKAEAIGRRIARLREQKGYTQAELAGKVGVTDGAVAQYERGYTVPRNTRLERIALVLDTTTDWLLTGGEPEEQAKAQTRVELAALTIIRSLPVERQEAALAMLEGLASATIKNKP